MERAYLDMIGKHEIFYLNKRDTISPLDPVTQRPILILIILCEIVADRICPLFSYEQLLRS